MLSSTWTDPFPNIFTPSDAIRVRVNPEHVRFAVQSNLTYFYEGTDALKRHREELFLFHVVHHSTGTNVVKCLLSTKNISYEFQSKPSTSSTEAA